MKRIVIIILFYLLNINILSQVSDSTEWISFTNDSLGISFDYPTYFNLNPWEYNDRHNSVAFISYLRYEPYELKENYFVELKLYSTLSIYISDSNFNKIAEENNFVKENDKWFDKYNHSYESADSFDFSSWRGLRTYTRSSISIKDLGILTQAADIDVFLLTKNINDKNTIVCYAKGFDFPEGEEILKKICNSIKNNK